ncbi:hypothetical protein DXG01_014227 [Tephrocybe rancida]|nr:hypothetical protein DXG01_014227 [Tephrocybe rancida]
MVLKLYLPPPSLRSVYTPQQSGKCRDQPRSAKFLEFSHEVTLFPYQAQALREYKLAVIGGGDIYRKQYVIDDEPAVLDIIVTTTQEEDNGQKYVSHICNDVLHALRFLTVTALFLGDNVILRGASPTKGRNSFPIVLVACKSDIPQYEREVSIDEGRQLAKDLGCPFHETSAKQRINVDEAFSDLASNAGQRSEPRLTFLVYSITSRDSFEKIVILHQEILRSKDQDSFSVIPVANKLDVEYERQVGINEGRELAKHLGCPFMETESAKQSINVDEAFSKIVREIKKYNKEEAGQPAMIGAIGGSPDAHGHKNAHDDAHGGSCAGCALL